MRWSHPHLNSEPSFKHRGLSGEICMIGAGIFSPLIEIPCTIQCELIWHQMFVVFFIFPACYSGTSLCYITQLVVQFQVRRMLHEVRSQKQLSLSHYPERVGLTELGNEFSHNLSSHTVKSAAISNKSIENSLTTSTSLRGVCLKRGVDELYIFILLITADFITTFYWFLFSCEMETNTVFTALFRSPGVWYKSANIVVHFI